MVTNRIGIGHFFAYVLCVLLILASSYYAVGRYQNEFRYAGVFDWPFFMEAARGFLQTGLLYDPDLSHFYPSAPVYKFPPLLGTSIVLQMKNSVPEEIIREVFAWMHLAMYLLVGAMATLLCAEQKKFLSVTMTWVVLATYEPFVVNFYRLQPEIFVLLLLVIAAIMAVKQKYGISGSLIGIAAALKIYPIFFLGPLLFGRSRYQSAAGFMLGVAATLLLTLPVIGLAEHWRYWTEIAPILLREDIYLSLENISMGAALLNWWPTLTIASWVGSVIMLVGLLWTGLGYWSSRGSGGWSQEAVWLAFSVFVASFVLGTKNAWWNYQLLLILPILSVIGIGLSDKHRDYFSVAGVIAACLCIYFMNSARWAPWLEISYSPVWPGALASVLVWLSTLRLYLRTCTQ